jgi:hypothetical protein
MTSAKVYKRYSNRKVYSVADKRYASIKEIVEVSKTQEVKIVENSTGEDVTAKLLLGGFHLYVGKSELNTIYDAARREFLKQSTVPAVVTTAELSL